ncbi:unnamed protein product [Arctogadus glacialis]
MTVVIKGRGLLRPWTELLIRTGLQESSRLEDLQFGRRSTVERRHSCFQMAAARFVRKGKQLRPELSPPRFVGT